MAEMTRAARAREAEERRAREAEVAEMTRAAREREAEEKRERMFLEAQEEAAIKAEGERLAEQARTDAKRRKELRKQNAEAKAEADSKAKVDAEAARLVEEAATKEHLKQKRARKAARKAEEKAERRRIKQEKVRAEQEKAGRIAAEKAAAEKAVREQLQAEKEEADRREAMKTAKLEALRLQNDRRKAERELREQAERDAAAAVAAKEQQEEMKRRRAVEEAARVRQRAEKEKRRCREAAERQRVVLASVAAEAAAVEEGERREAAERQRVQDLFAAAEEEERRLRAEREDEERDREQQRRQHRENERQLEEERVDQQHRQHLAKQETSTCRFPSRRRPFRFEPSRQQEEGNARQIEAERQQQLKQMEELEAFAAADALVAAMEGSDEEGKEGKEEEDESRAMGAPSTTSRRRPIAAAERAQPNGGEQRSLAAGSGSGSIARSGRITITAATAAAIAARETRLHRVCAGGLIEWDSGQPLYSSGTTRVWGGRFNGTQPAVIKRTAATDAGMGTSVEQKLLLELGHPSVIRMFGLPETDKDGHNMTFMAFEPCVDGDILTDTADGTGNGALHARTLEHVITIEELRGLDKVRPLMLQMAEGAKYLHNHSGLAERGLTHRDLKPANVLVKRSGRGGLCNEAKLTDFGSSKLHTDCTKATTQGVGTEGWQSPEGIRLEKTDSAADVFSMGLLFVYCLTGGRHAFGDTQRKRSKNMSSFAWDDDKEEDDEDEREKSVKAADKKLGRNVHKLVMHVGVVGEPSVGGGDGRGVGGVSGGSGGGRDEIRSLELAASLVTWMLRLRPSERPTMKEVVRDPFFTEMMSGGGGGGGSGCGDDTKATGDEGDDESECPFCMDATKDAVCVPCGHRGCMGCLLSVYDAVKNKCPTCRSDVQQIIRLF